MSVSNTLDQAHTKEREAWIYAAMGDARHAQRKWDPSCYKRSTCTLIHIHRIALLTLQSWIMMECVFSSSVCLLGKPCQATSSSVCNLRSNAKLPLASNEEPLPTTPGAAPECAEKSLPLCSTLKLFEVGLTFKVNFTRGSLFLEACLNPWAQPWWRTLQELVAISPQKSPVFLFKSLNPLHVCCFILYVLCNLLVSVMCCCDCAAVSLVK